MGTENVLITKAERKYKTLVTDIGNEKMAAAVLTGKKVNVVMAAVGDGGGSYYVPTADMTALKNEVWRGEISGKSINSKSPNMVDVKVVLPGSVGGFTVRECAIFDDEGDMIAVCNVPDAAKAVIEDGIASALTILMHIVMTNGDALSFTLSDPGAETAIVCEITIPHEGWAWQEPGEADEEIDEYRYFVDVPMEEATEAMYPSVALHKSALETAKNAGLCPCVQAMDGALRFWAKQEPEADMAATAALTGAGGSTSGGGTSYVLPIASATRLGGVKIGKGITVAEDGTISASDGGVNPDNLATSEDTSAMLDEIFPAEDET